MKGHGDWGIFLILKVNRQADLQERQGKPRELKASQLHLDSQESRGTNPGWMLLDVQAHGLKKVVGNSHHELANNRLPDQPDCILQSDVWHCGQVGKH